MYIENIQDISLELQETNNALDSFKYEMNLRMMDIADLLRDIRDVIDSNSTSNEYASTDNISNSNVNVNNSNRIKDVPKNSVKESPDILQLQKDIQKLKKRMSDLEREVERVKLEF